MAIRDIIEKFRTPQTPADLALQQVIQKYPKLQGANWQVGYGKSNDPNQQLEFYPPDESRNPKPGNPYIEIFNKGLQGDALQSAIFGDMLHYAPTISPQFAQSRQQFQNSLTPQQIDFHKRRYSESGDPRPFDQWMNQSGLDAHIRGYLAPDSADEWRRGKAYTPEQIKILEAMKTYLSSQ